MKQRSARPWLDDIIDAIDGMTATIDGMDFAAYRQSWQARRAVERGAEIISDATRRLPEAWLSDHPEVPWQEIRAIGNRLRHEYRRVDDASMWQVATESVRRLRPVISAFYDRLEPPKRA